MPRTVQITVPADRTDSLVDEMVRIPGLIGLRVQKGVSVQPPGDVISAEMTNRSLQALLPILDRQGLGEDPALSLTTSTPLSIVSPPATPTLIREESETTWEEMEFIIGKESNMTATALTVMAIAGVLAIVGVATNALHVVIASMLIAPGFEPITRISLGIAAGSAGWRRGLVYTAEGYAVLVLGAAATALVLRALGVPLPGGQATYLPAQVLVNYWTTVSGPSVVASALASIAGALLIITNRSVLTAGVMVALALIPTAAIAGMGLVLGQWQLVAGALSRWIIDALLVASLALLVFGWERNRRQRRRTRF